VVLGYHADGQREWGMWNNRVFEALASGAALISDRAAGLAEEFGDCLALTDGGDETVEHIGRLLGHEHERRRIAEAGRQLVMSSYTYDHAARRIADHYLLLAESRGLTPMRSAQGARIDGRVA
jgi:spore maturation protein CgeB